MIRISNVTQVFMKELKVLDSGLCDTLNEDISGGSDLDTKFFGHSGNDVFIAGKFTADTTISSDRCKAEFYIKKVGSPTFTFSARIYSNTVANLPGAAIGTASDIINAADVSTTVGFLPLPNLSATLTNGVDYWLVLESFEDGAGYDAVNYLETYTKFIDPASSTGTIARSNDGLTWTRIDIAGLEVCRMKLYS